MNDDDGKLEHVRSRDHVYRAHSDRGSLGILSPAESNAEFLVNYEFERASCGRDGAGFVNAHEHYHHDCEQFHRFRAPCPSSIIVLFFFLVVALFRILESIYLVICWFCVPQ